MSSEQIFDDASIEIVHDFILPAIPFMIARTVINSHVVRTIQEDGEGKAVLRFEPNFIFVATVILYAVLSQLDFGKAVHDAIDHGWIRNFQHLLVRTEPIFSDAHLTDGLRLLQLIQHQLFERRSELNRRVYRRAK